MAVVEPAHRRHEADRSRRRRAAPRAGRRASGRPARSAADRPVRRLEVAVERDRRQRHSGLGAGESEAPRPRTSSRTASSIRTVSAAPGNVPAATSAAYGATASRIVAAEVRVRPRVLRDAVAEPSEVGDDLDLAAAAGAGADPDRRDAQPLGDRRRELLRDELEHDRERARLLDRERVGEERPGLVAGLALDADLADRVDRLRRQPMWPMTGIPALTSASIDPGAPDAALDLDRLGAAPRAGSGRRCRAPPRASRRTGTACRRRSAPASCPGRRPSCGGASRPSSRGRSSRSRASPGRASRRRGSAGCPASSRMRGRREVVGGEHRRCARRRRTAWRCRRRSGGGRSRSVALMLRSRSGSVVRPVCAARVALVQRARDPIEQRGRRPRAWSAAGGRRATRRRRGSTTRFVSVPKPEPGLGDVVGDEQVDALAAELVGGPLERPGLGREPDEDRAAAPASRGAAAADAPARMSSVGSSSSVRPVAARELRRRRPTPAGSRRRRRP